MLVDAPVKVTLEYGLRNVRVPVYFTAGNALVQDWVVRFTNPSAPLAFEGFAYMDSLLIEGRYYNLDSEEARRLATVGNRFRAFAQSPDKLLFEPPATL